jgi:uncharacterized protein
LPTSVLILPGIGNSGPLHWQTLWEQSQPGFVRVEQRDWDAPVCGEWVAAIEDAVKRAGPDVLLVAHSLACLAVAHWAANPHSPHSPIKAALLVAVPNSTRPSFPKDAVGFSETPTQPFAFRSTVAVSDDDPFGSAENAERLAAAWGSRVVRIGSCGHINASSGLGDWPAGFELLKELQNA